MSMNPDLPDFIPSDHPNDTVPIDLSAAVDEDKVDLLMTANDTNNDISEASYATRVTTSNAARRNNTGEYGQHRTFNQPMDSHRGGYSPNNYGHSQDLRNTSQAQQENSSIRGGTRGKGDRGRRGGGRGDRRGGHGDQPKREFDSMDFHTNFTNQANHLKKPELNPYDEDGRVGPEIPGNQDKHKSYVGGGSGPWSENQPGTEHGGWSQMHKFSTSLERETGQTGTDTNFGLENTPWTRTDWDLTLEQAKQATDQGLNPAHSSFPTSTTHPTPDSQKLISSGSKRTTPRAANQRTSEVFPIHASNNEGKATPNEKTIEVSLGHFPQDAHPLIDVSTDTDGNFNKEIKSEQAIVSKVIYHQWIVREEFGVHYAQKGICFKPDEYQHTHHVSGIGAIEVQVPRRPSYTTTSTLTLKSVFHLPCAPCNVLDLDLLNHTFRIPKNQKAQAFDQSKAPVWCAHYSNDVARLAFSASQSSAMLEEVKPFEPTADEKVKLKAFLSTLKYWN